MEAVPAAARAGRDRLSELPDCLLHSVLSSLGSRQVVQSSLLSRRWRHLWRFVPCLDVDQRDFMSFDKPEPEAPAYNKAQKERLDREIKRHRSFEDFADAILLFHGGVSPLDACRLHAAHLTGLHRWVRRGLARRPTDLRVAYDCRSSNDDDDHDPLFSFDLASGGASALPVTGRLRRLHLSGVNLPKKFAEGLTSQCPVLQDLKLVDCEFDYKFGGRIASRSLKRLDIQGCYCKGSYQYYQYYNFRALDVLALPALVSMNLDTNRIALPDIEDARLPSLAVAAITDPNEYKGRFRFLKFLRNARVLELRSFTTTGLLEDEPEGLRQFHNLRTLILIECEIGDRGQMLIYVLENVPNLETLVLQDCKISGNCRGKSASSWCNTSSFHGCENLKSIRVNYADHVVPRVLVDVLAQIAKDQVKTRSGKRHYVSWLDWMRCVVGWQKKFLRQQRGYAYTVASAAVNSDNSQSDEEHESRVWKRRAGKKHDRDCVLKARRRAAHLARR